MIARGIQQILASEAVSALAAPPRREPPAAAGPPQAETGEAAAPPAPAASWESRR